MNPKIIWKGMPSKEKLHPFEQFLKPIKELDLI